MMKRPLKFAATIVAFASLASCVSGPVEQTPTQVDLLIENVRILDIRSGEYLDDHFVTVDDGVILGIIPRSNRLDFDAEEIVDGEANFLIPSLGDAHVHVMGEEDLAGYIRYGVTTVFNMSGSPSHLKMRARIKSGALLGPRLFTVGPTLDGEEPTNPLFTSVKPETAADIANWTKAQGYDAQKVYQQIDEATLAAVVAAGKSNGLITSGHVSRSIGIDGAFRAGLKYVAHGEELSFPAFVEDSRRYDRDLIPETAAMVRDSNVTVTPMINYLENIPPQVTQLDAFLASDDMRTVPAGMKQSWGARQGYFANREEPEAFVGQITDAAKYVAELTAEMNRQDVRLILGTDAGFGGAVPGYGAHLELQSLVNAGLTPLEALQTATLNMGDYLAEAGLITSGWGEIKPGHRADFLLLKRDPLADIAATQEIAAVAAFGNWLDASELAAIEQELVESQAALEPLAAEFESLVISADIDGLDALVSDYLSTGGKEQLMSASNCIFLGYRYYYRKKRDISAKIYENCAKLSPRDAPLLIHLARSRNSIGDVDGAVEAYQRALIANPWYKNPQAALDKIAASDVTPEARPDSD